jgi:type II secretory pathway pseudopilin PulG
MEVVIALTILGMITGTLFSIIQGSVKGAAQIEQVQRENDAINRFLDLCRKTFTTLPSTATLTLARLDPNAIESPQELTISGSPNCFGFGLRAISYEDTILGLRPDPNGLVDQNNALIQYLCLSREDLMPETDASGQPVQQELTGLSAPDDEGRYWMPLLPDVVTLKWRFFKEEDDAWLEEWDDSDWPQLIEVQLVMRDRVTPIRMVYSVPTLILTAGNGTPSSAGSSTDTSTVGGGGRPGNGGGRPGDGGGRPGDGGGRPGDGGGRPGDGGGRPGDGGGRPGDGVPPAGGQPQGGSR